MGSEDFVLVVGLGDGFLLVVGRSGGDWRWVAVGEGDGGGGGWWWEAEEGEVVVVKVVVLGRYLHGVWISE